MTPPVQFRYMTGAGTVIGGSSSVEDAILTYRKAIKKRKNPAIRGTGEYRISSGAEWLKI